MSRRAFIRVSTSLILVVAIVGAVFVYGLLTAIDHITPAAYRVTLGERPALSAAAWIVYDVELGDVLFSQQPDQVRSIASITKLPAAAVIYDIADLEATTTLTWSDLNTEGAAGRLGHGEVYSNRQLLFPLLLESSNDAAAALARVNPELLTYMNQYVQQLGLAQTQFADTSGLADANQSTARELMQLSRYIYQQYPYIMDITTVKDFYSADNGWLNNNPFESDPTYRGGKHGFTYAANRTTTSFFTETLSGQPRTLGYVLLGSDDLAVDMQQLREYVRARTIFD